MTMNKSELQDTLQILANYFGAVNAPKMQEQVLELKDSVSKLITELETANEQKDWYRDRVVWGFYEDSIPHYIQGIPGEHEINEPVTAENVRNMFKALEIYKRERDRFSHSHPEITGNFFLAGGYGSLDDNMLPEYVRICPAYGASWEQIYERTSKTITYEGS